MNGRDALDQWWERVRRWWERWRRVWQPAWSAVHSPVPARRVRLGTILDYECA
jgi:hypothetical protein